jgi:hypothetical protein
MQDDKAGESAGREACDVLLGVYMKENGWPWLKWEYVIGYY